MRQTIYQQIMPAPGWRCFRSWIQKDGFYSEQMSVIGWAMCTHQFNDDPDEYAVELLVWDSVMDHATDLRFLRECETAQFFQVIPPGHKLNRKLLKEGALEREKEITSASKTSKT